MWVSYSRDSSIGEGKGIYSAWNFPLVVICFCRQIEKPAWEMWEWDRFSLEPLIWGAKSPLWSTGEWRFSFTEEKFLLSNFQSPLTILEKAVLVLETNHCVSQKLAFMHSQFPPKKNQHSSWFKANLSTNYPTLYAICMHISMDYFFYLIGNFWIKPTETS